MRKSIILIVFIGVASNLLSQDFFNISGVNEIYYAYRSAEDSLKNFFSDEFGFRVTYNNLSLGGKYLAHLPKYDKFSSVEELSPQMISTKWDERYIEYRADGFSLLGGTFEEAFGNGIVLRAYKDKDFEVDTRLDGFSLNALYKRTQMKALYGAIPSEQDPSKNETVAGLDVTLDIIAPLRLGASMASLRNFNPVDNTYTHQDIFGGRIYVNRDRLDLTSEYGYTKEYHGKSREGNAIYAHLNTYFDKITISAAYKRYKDFNTRMNDLPTVNHSMEPLSDRVPPGKDEEGLMGEIRIIPDFSREFVINYSEAWNNDFSLQLSDIFCEMRYNFETFSLTGGYSAVEKLDKDWQIWEKEITPSLAVDFGYRDIPIMLRIEYQYFQEEHSKNKTSHYEPLLQIDISKNDLALSIIAEYSYQNLDDLFDNHVWLGAQLSLYRIHNTELHLFVGEEKGGKVCRNGICRYQSPFKGVRIEIANNF